MSVRYISYALIAVIAIALTVSLALSTSRVTSNNVESVRPPINQPGQENTSVSTQTDSRVSPNDVPSVSTLMYLCPDPFGDISDGCAEALDRRYLDERVTVERLHHSSFAWRRADDSLRSRLISPLLVLDSITWRDVLDDTENTNDAVRAALRNPECLIPEGQTRHDLREDCDADAIARLALLQEGCVMPLVMHGRRNPWQPKGSDDVWHGPLPAELDEDWHMLVEELDNDVNLGQNEYWRRRTEIDDAKLRFAWRLRKCGTVPDEALAWLDALPTPTGHTGDQDQGQYLETLAARLGSPWAQFRNRHSVADLVALRQTDPSLAHYIAGSMREGRVTDLVVAVEYAKRMGKQWLDLAVGALKATHTPEEIRESLPYALSVLQARGVVHDQPEWWDTLISVRE